MEHVGEVVVQCVAKCYLYRLLNRLRGCNTQEESTNDRFADEFPTLPLPAPSTQPSANGNGHQNAVNAAPNNAAKAKGARPAKSLRSKPITKRQRNLSSALDNGVALDSSAAVPAAPAAAISTEGAIASSKKKKRSKARLSAVVAQVYVDKLVAYSPIKESWLN
ncbi:unnamed protein product [Phytophthora lilii]|uniref:Unnamed protein product n=1 Tax=Phytophthora lilii TaxID=2077276 RepID=A0A9W6X1J8_9STRA|nr:unnamed protein product [Phytophthora lilii]